ncbi:hypothetical protein AK812_SmicGene31463 [Symbiodinium microadriaticum]|uniref:Uncharacterized protein n=1 Tax=Symbiodinium microadriaticum TaxID=2951 RepID=A0A1Q9CWL6_SYMMI|nr:hypothetical protein AK812_SmicGene31463 [Symbiodinium microadriaticum]CAE7616334.1 unnamed protein product [Symbiodinium microadriaticum]
MVRCCLAETRIHSMIAFGVMGWLMQRCLAVLSSGRLELARHFRKQSLQMGSILSFFFAKQLPAPEAQGTEEFCWDGRLGDNLDVLQSLFAKQAGGGFLRPVDA